MQRESSDKPEDLANQVPMIYILGNSHSGSTLLSFLLSFHPDIVNLGELKSKTWLKVRTCSCSHPLSHCPFYGDFFAGFNALKEPAMARIRDINPLWFIFRKKVSPDQSTSASLLAFYQAVSKRVRELYPGSRYIVDSSKSIWLLNAWLQVLQPGDIRIIWIRRNARANVASFKKRGTPFVKSLMTVIVNNLVTRYFLRNNHLTYLEVHYDRFYDAYADEASRMSEFLGLEIPLTNQGHGNHHVISGNAKTRQAFTNQFTGIHKDDEWERILTATEKKILSWLS